MKHNVYETDARAEIDLRLYRERIWRRRWPIVMVTIGGIILSVIIAWSIPREYSVPVVLAPENNGGSGSVASPLANMVGIGELGQRTDNETLSPQLYPEIVASTPFMLDMLSVDLSPAGYDRKLVDYMASLRRPWWEKIIDGMRSAVTEGGAEVNVDRTEDSDLLRLTVSEHKAVEELQRRLSAAVDKNTGVIRLGVKLQHPAVSALVADTMAALLRAYAVDYRTGKARAELDYAKKTQAEAQKDFIRARDNYAEYADRSRNAVTFGRVTQQVQLEKEMELTFQIYGQATQQVSAARASIAERTPAFTVIEPAVVPIKPSAPRRLLIVVGLTLAAFVISALVASASPLDRERGI